MKKQWNLFNCFFFFVEMVKRVCECCCNIMSRNIAIKTENPTINIKVKVFQSLTKKSLFICHLPIEREQIKSMQMNAMADMGILESNLRESREMQLIVIKIKLIKNL